MRQLFLVAVAVLTALSLELVALGTAEAQAGRSKPSMQKRLKDLQ